MKVLESNKKFGFNITRVHVKLAAKFRGQPCFCVVNQALCDKPGIVTASVHPTVTILYLESGNVRRYMTPPILREALDQWDKGGDWKLEPGKYFLLPIIPSKRIKVMRAYYEQRKKDGLLGNKRRIPLRRKPRSPRSLGNFARMRMERRAFCNLDKVQSAA